MSDNESRFQLQESVGERDEETRPNMSRPGTVRKIALLTTFASTVVLWGLVHLQQRNLEVEAAPLAGKAAQENTKPGLDVVSRLTVSRDAVFFGTPRAKVEVFIRDAGQSESTAIRGIEYHYAFENGSWLFTDSGSCTSEECTVRGREAFGQQ